MGAGDRFQEPRFSVPMPGGDRPWPFEVVSRSRLRRVAAQSQVELYYTCSVCGNVGAPGHYDARDTARVRRRVCFGRTP